MRTAHAILVTTSVLFASSGLAWAHAHLKAAAPPVGGTVSAAPHEIEITFTESVEPTLSSIEVQDSQGQRLDNADPHTAPTNAKQLIVSLKPVPPGAYKVIWHATSTDTHKTEGSYGFTVRP